MTQTIPLALAGGAGRLVEAALAEDGADLVERAGGSGWFAGMDDAGSDGAASRAAADLLDRLLPRLGVAEPPVAAADAGSSADAAFFLRLDDLAAGEPSVEAEEASASALPALVFLDFREDLEAGEALASAEADVLDFFLDLVDLEAVLESAASAESEDFFGDLLFLEAVFEADSVESAFSDLDDFFLAAFEGAGDFADSASFLAFFFFALGFVAVVSL